MPHVPTVTWLNVVVYSSVAVRTTGCADGVAVPPDRVTRAPFRSVWLTDLTVTTTCRVISCRMRSTTSPWPGRTFTVRCAPSPSASVTDRVYLPDATAANWYSPLTFVVAGVGVPV